MLRVRARRKLKGARPEYATLGKRPPARTRSPAAAVTEERDSRGGAREATGKVADAALAITSACSAAAAGFDLCALRTDDETIAVASRNAAAFLRALRASAEDAARAAGIDARPRARTCDRLRWEWLASTATVLDGSPAGRLATECARILADVDVPAAKRLGDGIAARLRVAVAEAHSLAGAIEQMHRGHVGGVAFAFG